MNLRLYILYVRIPVQYVVRTVLCRAHGNRSIRHCFHFCSMTYKMHGFDSHGHTYLLSELFVNLESYLEVDVIRKRAFDFQKIFHVVFILCM